MNTLRATLFLDTKSKMEDTPIRGLERTVKALSIIADCLELMGCSMRECDETVGFVCDNHTLQRIAVKALESVGAFDPKQ
jgi:hypothetical protein